MRGSSVSGSTGAVADGALVTLQGGCLGVAEVADGILAGVEEQGGNLSDTMPVSEAKLTGCETADIVLEGCGASLKVGQIPRRLV